MPTVDLIDLQNSEASRKYDAFLETVPGTLIQQSTFWCHVIKDISPDEPFVLVVREGRKILGALIVYLYRHELGNILYSNPHAGSIGSLAVHSEAEKVPVTKSLVGAALELAKQNHCLTVTLTSNPFAAEDPLVKAFTYDYVLTNKIQYIDLGDCFDVQGNFALSNAKFRNNLKRQLSRAAEAGLKVVESDSRDHLYQWYEVHRKRMADLHGNAIPYKLFSNALQLGARHDCCTFLYVLDGSGKVMGGGFHIYNKKIVDLFMLSTGHEGQKSGVNYLLIDHALRWAVKKGIKYYNWQASNPPDGSIAQFKKQWGSQTADYNYYTKITGHLGPIWQAGLDKVRRAYNWHYLLPFGAFTEPDKRNFTKHAVAFLPGRLGS